jgi:hypothetical protein
MSRQLSKMVSTRKFPSHPAPESDLFDRATLPKRTHDGQRLVADCLAQNRIGSIEAFCLNQKDSDIVRGDQRAIRRSEHIRAESGEFVAGEVPRPPSISALRLDLGWIAVRLIAAERRQCASDRPGAALACVRAFRSVRRRGRASGEERK